MYSEFNCAIPANKGNLNKYVIIPIMVELARKRELWYFSKLILELPRRIVSLEPSKCNSQLLLIFSKALYLG